jgi:hypothetical protein
MEPEEVRAWLRQSPIRIRMNNGDTYEVQSPEFALVGDYAMAVLARENGRLLNKLLSLLNISEIVQLPHPADQTS